jgi:hypothetical protein
MPGFILPFKWIRITVTLFILVSVIHAKPSMYHDVEIITSDNSGISFRLNISNPEQYLSESIGDTGYVFSKSIMIAVPPEAEPFITNIRIDKPMSITSIPAAGRNLGDNPTASIGNIKIIRGIKTVSLMINPIKNGYLYQIVEVSVQFQFDGKSIYLAPFPKEDKIFEPMLKALILNYEQMKDWPVIGEYQSAYKSYQDAFSPFGEWYKIAITSEGMIKIIGQNLASAGLSLSNLMSDSIHIFYGGGEPLPILNSAPRPEFREIAIIINDGGDGKFDYADYILFVAEKSEHWKFPVDSEPQFIENPYTNMNYYWLAVSGDFPDKGKRMGMLAGFPGGSFDTVITTGWFYARNGQNKMLRRDTINTVAGYLDWYWTDENQFTYYMDLPMALASESSLVKIRVWTFSPQLSINDVASTMVVSDIPFFYYLGTGRLKDGMNKFDLSMNDYYSFPPYLDYCEIYYKGDLTPTSDIIDVELVSSSDNAEISVEYSFSDAPFVLDLTDKFEPKMIDQATLLDGRLRFKYDFTGKNRAHLFLCASSKLNQAGKIEKVTLPSLQSYLVQTDMFVIAPQQFMSSLESYVSYRESKSDINVTLVSLEDIINQFSYGVYDPTAIRDFLKYAYENCASPAPSAVLLVGDGNYDYENILNTATLNFIPPYLHEYDSTASDDNYVFFGDYGLLDGDSSYPDDRGYDMMVARWPVRSLSQLNNIIEKARSYEASSNYAPWRATVTLVADDEFGSSSFESFHTTQTENLQKYHLPAGFRRNKIYLWDYPLDSKREKPDVNEAIINSFNEGSLLVNYAGHGNPDTWSHEHVFNRNSDLPQLKNSDKLTLVFTASCSIGFYDDPTREGMAEDLLRLPDAGAIATVAATRTVYAGDNAEFNRLCYDLLFGGDDLSICQSVYLAKVMRQYSYNPPRPIKNDQTYAFFGDPFVKLGIPNCEVKFTSTPDSLKALALHNIEGEVVESGTGNHTDFDGVLDIFVYDTEVDRYHKVYIGSQLYDSVNYSLGGPMIYRGKIAISDGNFGFSFIAPLDIGYGGKAARISGYAISDITDGFGLADSIPVSAYIASGSDMVGPEIGITFSNRSNFVSGDKISQGEKLMISISDSSGINLMGGLGHEIMLVIDNQVENAINLTDLFEYNLGSCYSGKLEYQIDNLDPGIHAFKVKVWDNANNSSVAEFNAEIVESNRLLISDLMNYPNPMKEQTTFSFLLTSPAKNVSLEIFTLSGKKIFDYSENSIIADYHEFFTWNGNDADGDRVSVGVYIYKVTAISENSDSAVESFGKIVVVN